MLQNNSHTAKREANLAQITAPNPTPRSEKVITGVVMRKPPGVLDVAAQSFFGSTADEVGRYLVIDVLLPAMKNLVSELVTTGVEMVLYGERRSATRKPGLFGQVNYSSQSTVKRFPSREEPPFSARDSRRYEDIVLASKSDAETVLSSMADIVEEYGAVSVADLCDLVGISTDYTDQKYGWTDIGRASVRRNRDGYLLEFPPPSILK